MPLINSQGDIAFQGTFGNSGEAFSQGSGIWLLDSQTTQLSAAALSDTFTPVLGDFAISEVFDDFALNNDGHIAFRAFLRDTVNGGNLVNSLIAWMTAVP